MMLCFRFKRNTRLLVSITLFLILTWLLSTINFKEFSLTNNNKKNTTHKIVLNNQRKDKILQKFYTILEYTKIIGSQKYCEQSLDNNLVHAFKDDEGFKKIFLNNNEKNPRTKYSYLDKCPYKNCFFTCQQDFVQESDALIFHNGDFDGELSKNRDRFKRLLEKRKSSQIWILWNDEAAVSDPKFDYFRFNWSLSFYTHSEVVNFAYGGYVEIGKSNFTLQWIINEFEKRSNSAVWFVSNCNSKFRIDLTSRLSEYFPITVNGECSSLLNGIKISKNKSIDCKRESKCETDYLANNKFYLAFESTTCSDYITEKFWRILSFGLIPIVFQPSRQSYERVAPPNSFIHAQDFNFDAQLLAQYLVNVSTNFDLYSSYLKWKLGFTTYFKADDVEAYRLCQMCTKLNTETSLIYYESISSWSDRQCKGV
jgi:glycoprotein 3-alpha-L-fucosyltransferase